MSYGTSKERKLKAILFVDIQGYTQLMSEDEEAAYIILSKFQECVGEFVKLYHGSVVNEMGDGMLSVFDSPLNATQCAIDLKMAFEEAPIVPVRMGIHSGTVVYDKGKVFGNSINIASRIESMSVPGAVLLSHKIRDDIVNQASIRLANLGSFHFKNLDEPVTVYAVANDGFIVPKKRDLGGKQKTKQSKAWMYMSVLLIVLFVVAGAYFGRAYLNGEKETFLEKSIAVLPFSNESTDEDNIYFCNGVMQSIINHLSKIESVRVVPRTSVEQFRNTTAVTVNIRNILHVAYILQGSVQRQGQRAIIYANLVDARNETTIWSMTFDRDLEDIFSVQSEITLKIAHELRAIITPSLRKRIESVPTTSTVAYDYFLKGNEIIANEFNATQTSEEWNGYLDNARLFYTKALERDSLFAEAMVGMAKVDLLRNKEADINKEDYLESVLELTNQAVAIDPNSPDAYLVRSQYYMFTAQPDKVERDLEKTIELNPNNVDALYRLSEFYYQSLDFEKAAGIFRKIESKISTSEDLYQLCDRYWWFYFKIGDMERSEHFALMKDSLRPDLHVGLWLVYGHQNREEDLLTRLEIEFPNENQFKLAMLASQYIQSKEFKESISIFQKWEALVTEESSDNQQSLHTWKRYGMALVELGDVAKGQRMLAKAVDSYTKILELGRFNNIDAMFSLAGIYTYMKEADLAYYWLEKIESSDGWRRNANLVIWMQYDVFFDNLRNDDRFKSIQKRAQEQQAAIQSQVRSLLPLTTF